MPHADTTANERFTLTTIFRYVNPLITDGLSIRSPEKPKTQSSTFCRVRNRKLDVLKLASQVCATETCKMQKLKNVLRIQQEERGMSRGLQVVRRRTFQACRGSNNHRPLVFCFVVQNWL